VKGVGSLKRAKRPRAAVNPAKLDHEVSFQVLVCNEKQTSITHGIVAASIRHFVLA
jgi:hypothetical protein